MCTTLTPVYMMNGKHTYGYTRNSICTERNFPGKSYPYNVKLSKSNTKVIIYSEVWLVGEEGGGVGYILVISLILKYCSVYLTHLCGVNTSASVLRTG